MPILLEPNLNLLTQEYVLVQAWKKTASYIRSHNWYADTLNLDQATVNLPEFISEVAGRFSNPEKWENDFLRLVPAPKSQRWQVDEYGNWKPIKRDDAAKKIRPLAHVTLRDQVAATALMLCLADRVESLQGDPRVQIDTEMNRKKVLSYGNRLYCDTADSGLRHRWGSSKLYRGFFQDYRAFLKRPEIVAEGHDGNIVVVHSDLRQFYDRVTPELLIEKIETLRRPGDDSDFFDLARNILCWEWHPRDEGEVKKYSSKAGLADFSRISLPQGLVASGFFSNVVMLQFDDVLRRAIGKDIDFIEGAELLDACRYVDDIRLVLACRRKMDPLELKGEVVKRLQSILDETATGTMLSEDKTKIAYFRGDERPLLRQSRKMERIQHAVSGGFDAVGGAEILDAIQGLVRAQSRYSKERIEGQGWLFAPVADVRDETVARFAAGRFRSTYRSLRPLLESQKIDGEEESGFEDDPTVVEIQQVDERKTQVELDDDARAFAFGLIENWVEDPSNVRLLRIGLDIWPAREILERVFELLRQYSSKGGRPTPQKHIAYYCLAEIFRAGATETGFVFDDECLPGSVDIEEYRRLLFEEATKLTIENPKSLPWYLKQQIFLFLAVNNPHQAPMLRRATSPDTKNYRDLIRFLRGETNGLSDRDYAIFATLAHRSFARTRGSIRLACVGLTRHRLKHIADLDPSFALELLNEKPDIAPGLASSNRSVDSQKEDGKKITLSCLVRSLTNEDRGKLANELTLLTFAEKFLSRWSSGPGVETLLPSDVWVEIRESDQGIDFIDVTFKANKAALNSSPYRMPDWCKAESRWRLQLGFLLRFILTGQHDFSKPVRPASWKAEAAIYRIPESHWYQRIYGLHSGHNAFGADWLPITDWIEQFLYSLLRWPGCRPSAFCKNIDHGIDEVRSLVTERIQKLRDLWGGMSKVLMLPLTPKWPQKLPEKHSGVRPLRACVVQTVIPTPRDIQGAHDLTFSDPSLRKRHRQHISAALSAITRMLHLRETYKKSDGRLDLVIFPELSVHPKDVETHLVPFARAHKTIILAGLTYEELFSGKPFINSALWIIPVWSEDKGLEILRRRQGKMNLAPTEKRKNYPDPRLQGFRPCQWLIGYPWDATGKKDPLWLTGSICYDATDINLACDLRDKSDVFAVSALNKDVKTFDQMAIALQYHMFQMVIVANNGEFGGSNAYAPYSDAFERQIFHLHGKQTLMAFVEIPEIEEFQRRKSHATEPPTEKSGSSKKWKCPPAGICSGEVCPHK